MKLPLLPVGIADWKRKHRNVSDGALVAGEVGDYPKVASQAARTGRVWYGTVPYLTICK